MLTWLRYTGRPRFGMTSGVLWFMYSGCPIREGMVLKFDTKEEAERVKIGTIAKSKTLFELVK